MATSIATDVSASAIGSRSTAPARRRQQGRQPGRYAQVLVQQSPGQHAQGVEQVDLARDQQHERGHDESVEREARPTGRARCQACFSLAAGVMRAPHEHTMLRVAHWMLRRRPHSGQPRYVPGLRRVPTGLENVRRSGSLMVSPRG